jgi:hypothetical protein
MHRNKRTRLHWLLRLAEGRARISTPEAAAKMLTRARRRLGGLKGGAPTLAETDETIVRVAASVALDCYRRNPETLRRDVVRLVARKVAGRDAMFHPDGRRRDSRDGVRRKAEKYAERLLNAACTLDDFASTLISCDFG